MFIVPICCATTLADLLNSLCRARRWQFMHWCHCCHPLISVSLILEISEKQQEKNREEVTNTRTCDANSIQVFDFR